MSEVSGKTRHGVDLFKLVVGVIAVVTTFLIIYPILRMAIAAIAPGIGTGELVVVKVLTDPKFLVAARNTGILALVTVLFSIPIAFTFAWLNERTDARMGTVSVILPIVPILVPGTAKVIGWLFLGDADVGYLSHALTSLLQAIGVPVTASPLSIETWYGMAFLYVLACVPFVYVIAIPAFRALDPSLEEAARMCGRSPFRIYASISLPAVWNAVESAALLVFIVSVGVYTIPVIIGTPANIPVLSIYLADLVNGTYPARIDEAVIVGLLMILVVGSLWYVQQKRGDRRRGATVGGKGMRVSPIRLGRARWAARAVMLAYIAMTTIMPLGALALVAMQPYWQPVVDFRQLSFQNFHLVLTQNSAVAAFRNSLFLAILVASTTMAVMAALAIYSNRYRNRLGLFSAGVTKLPAAVPEIVMALGFLVAFGGTPFWLYGSLTLVFLAYIVCHLTPASITAYAAISQIGKDLIEASFVSGAGSLRTATRVIIPLMTSGVAGGWALVFVMIIGDLNVATILGSPSSPVIGFYLLNIYENGTYAQLAAVACLITLMSTTVVTAVLMIFKPRYQSKQ